MESNSAKSDNFSALKNIGLYHKKNLVFMILSLATAAVGGFYVYKTFYGYFLSKNIGSFNTLVVQTFGALKVGLLNNYLASQTLSQVVALNCQTVSHWPKCSVNSDMFVKIASPLTKMSYMRNAVLIPIISDPPKNVDSFEEFAYDFYKSNSLFYRVSDGNTGGNAVFNGGIYSVSAKGEKYHNTDGSTLFSKKNILTPILQVSEPSSLGAVMYNTHSEYSRGKAIDQVIDAWDNNVRNRSAVSSMIQLVQDKSPRPASNMFHPISPAFDSTQLVGFIGIVHNWDTVLFQAVPTNSKSVQIVVSDGVQLATFLVSSDAVKFVGWGDVYDRTYVQYRQSYTPSDLLTGYSQYSFDIYPTTDFFPSDEVLLSAMSCLIAVAFVLIIAIAFVVHSVHLQGQLWQQLELLTLKQKFVRFISHEIRTPMNTVCIGLKLLLGEVEQSLQNLKKGMDQQTGVPEATMHAELMSIMSDNHSVGMSDDDLDSEGIKVDSDVVVAPQQNNALKACNDLVLKIQSWFELLTEVEESAANAVTTLNELLSYDKIEQNTMTIEKETLPAWETISSSIKPFNIQARERNMEIVMQFESTAMPLSESSKDNLFDSDSHQKDLSELVVIGDSVRLTQVFRNLVSNALKFSSPGSKVWVTAVWCPESLLKQGAAMIASIDPSKRSQYTARGSLKITVQDCGPGLTADNLKRLFGEGVQFNANKLQAGGGSGLGLWIAKGIIDLHFGTITATSPGLGGGCTFTVELPVMRHINGIGDDLFMQSDIIDELDASKDRALAARITPYVNSDDDVECADHSAHLKSLSKVLVVDDSGPSRKMLCRVMNTLGCTCYEAEDGFDCIRQYTNCMSSGDPTFDLVLMDFIMPVMHGPEATVELRKAGYKGAVIGVTGNVLQDDVDHFIRSGADAVLAKPLNIPKLKEALRSLGFRSLGDTIL